MKLSAAATLLQADFIGNDDAFDSVSTDTRTLRPGQLFIALQGPNFNGNDFVSQAAEQGAVGAIVSQTVNAPLPTLKVDDTKVALTQLARQHREQIAIPLIAVTGSCGKTTTRALLASVFAQCGHVLASKGSYNNDIGVPLTLLRLAHDHDYGVIEMGANHAGEIAQLTHLVEPDVAIITNAGAAHLEGFGSLDGVARAKGEIFQGLPPNGTAIINNDDRYADYWRSLNTAKRIVTFASDNPADVTASDILIDEQALARFSLHLPGDEITVKLPLMGRHNVNNALAAAAAAYALGLPLAAIKRGLETVTAVQRRLNEYLGINGATIIDDSYNANPSSVTAAIEVLSKRAQHSILVLGDMLELGAEADELHAKIGRTARLAGIECLYCYGRHSRHAAEAFGKRGYHFSEQAGLLDALRDYLQSNMTVLIKGSLSMKMNQITAALLKE